MDVSCCRPDSVSGQVSFTLNEDLTMIESMGEKVSMVRAPREHPFTLQTVGGQTLAVFTETSSGEEFLTPPSLPGLNYSFKGSRSQTSIEHKNNSKIK